MKIRIISTSASERTPQGWRGQIYADVGGLTFRWTCSHNHRTSSTAAKCAKQAAAEIEDNDDAS